MGANYKHCTKDFGLSFVSQPTVSLELMVFSQCKCFQLSSGKTTTLYECLNPHLGYLYGVTCIDIFCPPSPRKELCNDRCKTSVIRSKSPWQCQASGLRRTMNIADQYRSMPIKILQLIQNTSQ